MADIQLKVNGHVHTVTVEDMTMPLLWVLRDLLALTGTKYGCGIGACGACTVHLDGTPHHSCQVPISAVGSQSVTTIEGISPDHGSSLQRAWIAEEAPACGYCQPGQLMAAAALLARNPTPSDADTDAALSGNLCRCGTYQRIRRAVHRAAQG